MRAGLAGRAERVRALVPVGCPVCRDWPPAWLIGEGDPEPPDTCGRCGRMAPPIVSLVGVRSADV